LKDRRIEIPHKTTQAWAVPHGAQLPLHVSDYGWVSRMRLVGPHTKIIAA